MKKTALSLSLLFLVSTAAMTGCSSSDVKGKQVDGKDVLFSINGNDYYADDLFGIDSDNFTFSFLNSNEGIIALYEAIEKAVIQTAMPVNQNIQNAADLAYEEWEEDVQALADDNSISVREARASQLESEGYETIEDLKAALLFTEQRTALQTTFKNTRTEPKLTNRAVGDPETMLEKYVTDAAPMVVSHILATLSDSSNSYDTAAITEDEAINISTIVRRLTLGKSSGNTFSQIAGQLSSDSTSAAKGGSLGIMDNYTSFVNEFKLGLYAYEAYAKKENATASATLSSALGINDQIEAMLFGTEGIYPDYTIESVDVGELYESLHDNASSIGVQPDLTKENTDLYPRNIFFNEELNKSKIQFLKVDTTTIDPTVFPAADRQVNAQGYVTDANGNPIVLVRSTYGIHFLSINFSTIGLSTADATKYFMYLSQDATSLTNTYVKTAPITGYESLALAQEARKDEIEAKILNYVKGGFASTVSPSDSNFDYELFNYYFANGTITVPDQDIATAVNQFLSTQATSLESNIEDSINSAWVTYIYKIQYEISSESWVK